MDMLEITTTMVDVRMRVSFHDWENATIYAAIKVDIAVVALPTFADVPSNIMFVSLVIWFVISPLPSLSKKATF